MGVIARLGALVVGLAVVAGCAGAGYFYTQLAPAGNPGEVLYLIRKGDTLYSVARDLRQKQLLRNPDAFKLWARIKGWQDQIQTGYFHLDGSMSATEILEKLIKGHSEKIPYTIPEGYRIDQAAQNLANYQLKPATYEQLARQPDSQLLSEFPFLRETSGKTSLEGYLYPDTYYLSGSERGLIESQLDTFQKKVMPVWDTRPASHPLNLDQTIKLASVVELEAMANRELPIVAQVFRKRLKIGMKLESDPTAEYALGWHQGAKGLSLKDIAIDSPYNTYRYPGLPPTPIGNPSLDAIKAVIYPASTDYLYFVAKGDGTHAFSKTYQEHLNAIRRIWAAKKAG